MIRVYCRCNSGHYFEGEHCHLDGWSSPASSELAAAVRKLEGDGAALSVSSLRSSGVSEDALKRSIIVEFGDQEAAFDLVAPEGYVVDGTWIPSKAFDARFT